MLSHKLKQSNHLKLEQTLKKRLKKLFEKDLNDAIAKSKHANNESTATFCINSEGKGFSNDKENVSMHNQKNHTQDKNIKIKIQNRISKESSLMKKEKNKDKTKIQQKPQKKKRKMMKGPTAAGYIPLKKNKKKQEEINKTLDSFKCKISKCTEHHIPKTVKKKQIHDRSKSIISSSHKNTKHDGEVQTQSSESNDLKHSKTKTIENKGNSKYRKIKKLNEITKQKIKDKFRMSNMSQDGGKNLKSKKKVKDIELIFENKLNQFKTKLEPHKESLTSCKMENERAIDRFVSTRNAFNSIEKNDVQNIKKKSLSEYLCDEKNIFLDSDFEDNEILFNSDYEDDSYSEEDSYEDSYLEEDSDYEYDSYPEEEEFNCRNDLSDINENSNISSSNDESYHLPEHIEEDLYMANGTATKYEIDEKMSIKFNSDDDGPQIIELPSTITKIESNFKNDSLKMPAKINKEIEVFQEFDESSNSSCPILVPISTNCIENSTSETNKQSNETVWQLTSEDDCFSSLSEDTERKFCISETQQNTLREASKMKPVIFNSFSILNENHYIMNTTSSFSATENSIIEEILHTSYKKQDENNSSSIFITSNKNSSDKVGKINIDASEFVENFKTNQITETINKVKPMNSKFYNAINSRKVLVLLENKIHFYGTLKLKLVAGSIEIFGYKPDLNECVEIYSPRGYSFINVRLYACSNPSDIKYILKEYKGMFFESDLDEIVQNFNHEKNALLLLEKNCQTKKIEFLGKYMKENLFPTMNPIHIDRPYFASELILRSIIYDNTDNDLIVNPKWNTFDMKNSTRLMIIGGKSVGKSTCLRYLVNKNIKKFKKILLIDLDVGQSEVFLPQTVSLTILNRPLLGPGYFYDINPQKAIVYGDINIVLAPERYLKCIKELSQFCKDNKEYDNIPWIINTMGYNKGFGSELIAVLCHFFRPSHLLQLQSYKFANNFDFLMEKENLKKIPLNVFKHENLTLETSFGNIKYMEGADWSVILMESYLNEKHKRLAGKKKEWSMFSKDSRHVMLIMKLGAILCESFDWLTDVKPICCSLSDIKFKLYSNSTMSWEEILHIVNANLVYLCHYKDNKSCLECYGVGIVRGVDKGNGKIFLISSVSKNVIQYVNCLAVCNIAISSSIFINQGPKINGKISYVYSTNASTVSRAIKHFNRSKQDLRKNDI